MANKLDQIIIYKINPHQTVINLLNLRRLRISEKAVSSYMRMECIFSIPCKISKIVLFNNYKNLWIIVSCTISNKLVDVNNYLIKNKPYH